MSHFVGLGLQVALIMSMGTHFQRYAFSDGDTQGFQCAVLFRVVGQQANVVLAELVQHGRGDIIGAGVGRESQLMIGLDGVHSLVLQFIGSDLVAQTDASAFLPQIKNDACAGFLDALHGRAQLCTAVAAQGSERITCQAFRMQADQ